jgi:prevent-host-death family protein
MRVSFSVASGQKNFPKVVAASEKGDPVPIERHGETVAYVVSRARFHAMLETIELLSNREFVDTLRQVEAGEVTWTPLEDVDV